MPRVTPEQITALNPWFAPAILDGHAVLSGVGSTWKHADLAARHVYREALLVKELAKRYSVKGKSILDLGCNCGYWLGKYAQLGAKKVVGVEGRQNTIKQAELYWYANQFLPTESYKFILGDVSDDKLWETIKGLGSFDMTLCAGLLYHIPNYRKTLSHIAISTKEIIVIDTRVTHGKEVPMSEKLDLFFNGVDFITPKRVPNLKELLAFCRAIGFQPEVLAAPGPVPAGLAGPDDYVKLNRVTIVAKRISK